MNRLILIVLVVISMTSCSDRKVVQFGCTWNIPDGMKLVSRRPLTFSNSDLVLDGKAEGTIKSISFYFDPDHKQKNDLFRLDNQKGQCRLII